MSSMKTTKNPPMIVPGGYTKSGPRTDSSGAAIAPSGMGPAMEPNRNGPLADPNG